MVLDSPNNLAVSHPKNSLSAHKPTEKGSDDIPRFEDFYFKPLDQIVRRSRRVSGTSSNPTTNIR